MSDLFPHLSNAGLSLDIRLGADTDVQRAQWVSWSVKDCVQRDVIGATAFADLITREWVPNVV